MAAFPRLMNEHRLRVLHVDDNPDSRALLSILLKYQDDLEEAGSRRGADGLEEAIRECGPDVLLIDLLMQGKDPIEAIRGARVAFPELRIVVLSGSSDPKLLERARAAGASQLVQKRMDIHETL